MAPTPVVDALGLAEDAILAALAPLGHAVWAPEPSDLAGRLALPATDPNALPRVFIAHHQDAGGRARNHLHSDGWEGLVTIRVRSRDRTLARAGLSAAVAALAAVTAPVGYALHPDWVRPLDVPRTDLKTFTSAGIWRISIRRVPATP